MLIDIHQARLQLGKDDHLRLNGARGARLTTVSGIAWITLDRETRDTVVSAGESFVLPSDRAVLVGPLFSSLTLDLKGAPDALTMACGEQWRSGVGAWLSMLRSSVLGHLPRRLQAV